MQTKSKEELVQAMHMAKLFTEDIVAEFFAMQDGKLFDAWKNSDVLDAVTREKIYVQTQGIKAFQEFIKKTIVAGKNAERDLKEKYDKEVAAIEKSNRKKQ